MDKFKNLITQHKKASLLALFAIIVFTGFSITSAMNVAHRRAVDAPTRGDEAIEDAENNEQPIEVELTDSQMKLIKEYDDTRLDLRGFADHVRVSTQGTH